MFLSSIGVPHKVLQLKVCEKKKKKNKRFVSASVVFFVSKVDRVRALDGGMELLQSKIRYTTFVEVGRVAFAQNGSGVISKSMAQLVKMRK